MAQYFDVVSCDPPYRFSDSLNHSKVKRGAAANYKTMSIADIKALRVKEIASPDGCLLALWVPSSLLQQGLDIMAAWNFKHKQTYIWTKTKKQTLTSLIKSIKKIIRTIKVSDLIKSIIKLIKGHDLNNELAFEMGHLFRQTHEICLIGINNNGVYKKLLNKSQRSVSLAPNLKHSAKPENLQDSLDVMFSGPKCEIFARRQRLGWVCLGNQSPATFGQDITDSLEDLIK